jgi:hypothetical protein
MEPSAANLMQTARRQREGRGQGAEERYRELNARFHADAEFDSFGLRQCILEMREQPGGLLPPTKPSLRGAVGAFLIRMQARSLWWLLRAVRAPERALEASYETLRYQHARQVDLEKSVLALEARIQKLEERGRRD